MPAILEVPKPPTAADSGLDTPAPPAPSGVVIGEVMSTDADGRVWLRLPLPVLKRTCAACCLCAPSELAPGQRVAVLFQERNADLAVVIGPVVAECTPSTPAMVGKADALAFEAERQITLRCGKASIQLQSDGSVLIRGAYVLSRASGTNRIRGGNVQIN